MPPAPTPQKRARKPRKVIGNKRAPLPANAQISKRPLLRPAIPSPYTNSSSPKIVYISARSPFLAAVKRIEKLLRLSEKRAVQSAAAQIKKSRRRRGGPASRDGEDDIEGIARVMEEKKKGVKRGGSKPEGDEENEAGEEVAVKGTGKAINKVMELGLWFQQREDYAVRLATGSAGAIDDIEVNEEEETGEGDVEAQTEAGAEEVDDQNSRADGQATGDTTTNEAKQPIPETRIRYTSVLEVYVSLR